MNMQLSTQTHSHSHHKRRFGWLFVLGVVLLSGLMTGCSRPGEESVKSLVEEAYTCKHIEVVDFNKFDSMAGLYSYVAQYTFKVRFVEGEKGAQKFFNELSSIVNMKGDKWEEWMQQEAVQDYINDECTEAGAVALERMSEIVLQQMHEKKKMVAMPLVMPMVGWAEYMPGRKGWDITMRRDRLSGEAELSAPVKREVLLRKVKMKKVQKK